MSLQTGAKVKQGDAIERFSGKPVKAMDNTQPDRGAASQAPRPRHVPSGSARKAKGPHRRLFEEKARCLVYYYGQSTALAATPEGNAIIKAQGYPQTI